MRCLLRLAASIIRYEYTYICYTISIAPSQSSQLNNSLMKSVPNSIISIITHSGIGINTYTAYNYDLRTKHPKQKMESNQNSQGGSIPLEIEKCQFYVVRAYLSKSITFYYVCEEHVPCSMLIGMHLLRQRINEGANFIWFWNFGWITINRLCEQVCIDVVPGAYVRALIEWHWWNGNNVAHYFIIITWTSEICVRSWDISQTASLIGPDDGDDDDDDASEMHIRVIKYPPKNS